MARSGSNRRKSRQQKRSIQVASRASVRMEQHHADVAQRQHDAAQPAIVLAPPGNIPINRLPCVGEASDANDLPWLWRIDFHHVRLHLRSEQRLLVYVPYEARWTVGQAVAKKRGLDFFAARLASERPAPLLTDYIMLGAACEGRYHPGFDAVVPLTTEERK